VEGVFVEIMVPSSRAATASVKVPPTSMPIT
jgi:hypothetical protein